jgi:hypothetical protein
MGGSRRRRRRDPRALGAALTRCGGRLLGRRRDAGGRRSAHGRSRVARRSRSAYGDLRSPHARAAASLGPILGGPVAAGHRRRPALRRSVHGARATPRAPEQRGGMDRQPARAARADAVAGRSVQISPDAQSDAVRAPGETGAGGRRQAEHSHSERPVRDRERRAWKSRRLHGQLDPGPHRSQRGAASFDGGDGTVGLHGRGGASLNDPLGNALSNGCIRLANDAIDAIVRRIGRYELPGTPADVE